VFYSRRRLVIKGYGSPILFAKKPLSLKIRPFSYQAAIRNRCGFESLNQPAI
jgi:hypothetical protein